MKIKRHCKTSAAGDTSGYESAEQQTEKPCVRLLTKANAGLGIGCYSIQLNKEITVEGSRCSLNASFVVCLLRVCSQTLPHQAKASSGDKCKSHQALDLPKKCQLDAAQDGQARRQQKELQACVTVLTATIRRCIT
ncbi:hypothetical protein PC129_g15001 [Phytophthora cactorum]|uniref:Uncharacterized protein n=1 Tax=Phytophthora cactorum TaxID=29920 RepID=A0A8T1HQA5_9STRA|nr:hypothetical protein PC129_g15001 [Phytophthora cactorum]KAG4231232.1 hypothetical protein PC116_g20488 [Phytophthora cactorum]